MTEIYTHPETGETVEIPEGAEVVRNADLPEHERNRSWVDGDGNEHEYGDDAIHYWRNPSTYTEESPHPDLKPEYESTLDRAGLTRRVLQQVTDEVDQSWLGPRNTPPAVAFALLRDNETKAIKPEDGLGEAQQRVQERLDTLVEKGLVEKREDDSYAVTEAGRVELRN